MRAEILKNQIIQIMEEDRKIEKSIVAGGNVVKSVNSTDNDSSCHTTILKQVRAQSFWISLVVGVLSSIIASVIMHYVL